MFGQESNIGYLVEAEHFSDHGGWVLDSQFVDETGSAVLLAHGLGRPVADALTLLKSVEPGPYRLWVRTRDWTHGTGASAGRFSVRINGRSVDQEFGTRAGEWGWEDGGLVQLKQGANELRLHDLTGFDGRCDCIFFSRDSNGAPPNGAAELDEFRRTMLGLPQRPRDAGNYDLVVVGAGVAGICAAVGAARLGLKVALVECRDVLGGNNSSRVRVHISAKRNMDPWPKLGDLTGEMNKAMHVTRPTESRSFSIGDRQKHDLVSEEENLTLYRNHHLHGVEKQGDTITSVQVRDLNSGSTLRLKAPLFCDASGDGDLAVSAGCEYHIGRESRVEYGEARAPETADNQVLGATLHWFSIPAKEHFDFPETPWALPIDGATAWPAKKSAWNWEAGYWLNQATHGEETRDLLLRSIYGNWSFLKHDPRRRDSFRKHALEWCSHTLGRRESRRVMGDVVLTRNDIPSTGEKYPDAAVPCNWGIDVHVPEQRYVKALGKEAFRSKALHNDRGQTYAVMPYRCLYAKDVTNCFLAGRCASMSHLAHAMFRCQGTTGMMGETVAMAAAVAAEKNATPRDVYHRHLSKFKKMLARGF